MERTCTYCDGPLRTTNPKALYCTLACGKRAAFARDPTKQDRVNAANRAQQAERRANYVPLSRIHFIICPYCDELSTVRRSCALSCRKDECRRARARHRLASGIVRQRSARIAPSARVEPFDRMDIFERDDWICGICQKPVDKTLKWPDKGSRTIDHIVPLSLLGDHTPENVRLAHMVCNVTRGNRM